MPLILSILSAAVPQWLNIPPSLVLVTTTFGSIMIPNYVGETTVIQSKLSIFNKPTQYQPLAQSISIECNSAIEKEHFYLLSTIVVICVLVDHISVEIIIN